MRNWCACAELRGVEMTGVDACIDWEYADREGVTVLGRLLTVPWLREADLQTRPGTGTVVHWERPLSMDTRGAPGALCNYNWPLPGRRASP